MRISDWSSDVCSSDLRELDLFISRLPSHAMDDELRYEVLYEDTLCVIASQLHPLAHRKRIRYSELSAERWTLPAEGTFFREHIQRTLEVGEIGRASCRERVCK